ncbi:retinol dehydrogenase 11-like isoform X2 [Chelonus insularis]|uniref:retinol dehydrogenase 11-like isoform X2 n=1 Tax=Chelonus insularis TaxID=460826 RepID=UPI001588FE85|nr:retinol dehydrogenase 11-like isoform X2 [Chelonus insularis]
MQGARVILACRNVAKAEEAVEEIKTTPPTKPNRAQFNGDPGELAVCHLDLCNLASVRKCAQILNDTEANIHILINNAGVMMCPYAKTDDGYETQFQSNHLGHFLFTLLLLPKIIKSTPARIINVSSLAHVFGDINFDDINSERSYSARTAYAQSKLANVLFTKELARRLEEVKIEGITTYSLHPGVIATDLGRHFSKTMFPGARFGFENLLAPFIKTPELGAQTTIHCATDKKAGTETGLYYKECGITSSSSASNNIEKARRLWDVSVKLIGAEPKNDLNELLASLVPTK